eukprot:GHVS01051488.1.p2 GENE.GHVS01051488.1~~GHVS01051488.1.p2  ORF type:complete len:102 (-),score=29.07 GHVS01051488.1:259-564(-)
MEEERLRRKAVRPEAVRITEADSIVSGEPDIANTSSTSSCSRNCCSTSNSSGNSSGNSPGNSSSSNSDGNSSGSRCEVGDDVLWNNFCVLNISTIDKTEEM